MRVLAAVRRSVWARLLRRYHVASQHCGWRSRREPGNRRLL